MQKQMKGQKMMINPGQEVIDHTKNEWCWKHPIDFENPEHYTEADKLKIEKIRLIPMKQEQKDGTIRRYKMCPKCFVTVDLPDRNEGANVDGFTVK